MSHFRHRRLGLGLCGSSTQMKTTFIWVFGIACLLLISGDSFAQDRDRSQDGKQENRGRNTRDLREREKSSQEHDERAQRERDERAERERDERTERERDERAERERDERAERERDERAERERDERAERERRGREELHGGRGNPHGEAFERIRHLHEAAANLERAGFGEEANGLRERAEHMEMDLNRRRQAEGRSFHPQELEEIMRQFNELRKMVEHLQRENNALRKKVEELAKQQRDR